MTANVMRSRIEGEIVIERPVEEVFDFVADERNEPRFNSRITRVEKLSPGPIGAGTRFRAEMTRMGLTAEMTVEFTGVERPRRVESSTHLSKMDIRGTLTFDPVPEGTRMNWAWDLEPHGLLRLAGPILAWMGERQERAIWTSLKRLLEAS